MIQSSLMLQFLLLSSLVDAAPEADNNANNWPPYEINRFQKDIELPFKRGRIKIINPYGSVVVKNTTHHSVGLMATIQEIGEAPAIHQYHQELVNDQLMIKISYADIDLKAHDEKSSEYPIGRVDLGVFIPVDLKLEVETQSGDVEVKRVDNPVVLNTTSGTISVSSKADISASTVSGEIQALPMDTQWQNGIDLKTVTGKIFATVPINADFELKLNTRGQVMSRLETTSQWTQLETDQWHKVYGKKGIIYRINSEQGDIYLSPHNK